MSNNLELPFGEKAINFEKTPAIFRCNHPQGVIILPKPFRIVIGILFAAVPGCSDSPAAFRQASMPDFSSLARIPARSQSR
jgi:hypothetical protein